MQTLEEVIAEVLEDIDRPDLVTVARKAARNVLFSCHGIAAFQRDMVESAATTVTQADVAITLPSNFRKLSYIKAFDTAGEQILSVQYNLKGAKPYVDYFGFTAVDFTYNLQGGACFIQHPSQPYPTTVKLVYFAYPTFVVVAETGLVSTDSWMLAYNADYIKAKILMRLVGLIGNSALLQVAAADAEAALFRLLSSELHTLPEG